MAAIRLVVTLMLVVCLPCATLAKEPSARKLYKDARKAEKNKDIARAYLLYSQAAAKDPTIKDAWIRAQALRRRAVSDANIAPNFGVSLPTYADKLADVLPPATPKEVEETRRPRPPFELKADDSQLRDFNLRADAKALFEQVAKQYGLDVIFDGDYQPGPPMRFRISEADHRQALYALMTATGSFIVPISNRVFMVVKDTEQKRREVENHIAISVPIPEPVTVQEAQELGRAVQQVMEIQRFAIDTTQRLVIFRDRASKVRPAEALLRQMMLHKPQVELEVELLSVGSTSTLNLGLSLPTDFPIVPFYDLGRHQRIIPKGFTNFMTFGGGMTYLGIGVTSAQLLANWNRSNTRSMLQAQVRAIDGQAANFHVGDKYPIMTLGYFGNVQQGDNVYTPPPTFQFEDLGLVLKITPKVHDSREVTLEVEAEFKMLGAASYNGIPVVANRKFNMRVRLNFDQSAVIAGLMNNTQARLLSGLAGVINVPILSSILGNTSTTKDNGEILLSIKPRLLSIPASETVSREIFVGSESRPLTLM